MREQPRYLMNAQVLFSRELVLREALLDRRSIVRSGRHGSGWVINSLRPEGSLLGIQHSRDPSLWIIQMDAHDWGRVRIRNGYERPRLVVDPAPTISGNLADCLEDDAGTVRPNVRTLHINYAAKRYVGNGRYKDVLGRSGRSCDSQARRTSRKKAGKQDGKRIWALQRRYEPKEYPDCPGLARNMGAGRSGPCSHISHRHGTHYHRIAQSLGESSATRRLD